MEKRPIVAALAGNPNVGKSSIFNGLTGLRQHTGNWPGKTVASAQGVFQYGGRDFLLVDLPGTYSLCPHSEEEEVTRNFLASGQADVIVAVCDATCLERGLYLLSQITRLDCVRDHGLPIVLCINLCDEAEKKGISIDFSLLQDVLRFLWFPAVPDGLAPSMRSDRPFLMPAVKSFLMTAWIFRRNFWRPRRFPTAGPITGPEMN